jgi:hypothetical protein
VRKTLALLIVFLLYRKEAFPIKQKEAFFSYKNVAKKGPITFDLPIK